jgi:hypothetical protein
MRSLSNEEQNLITRFAEKLNENKRSQLLVDAAHATAKEVSTDGSRILFNIADYRRPSYHGQHSVGVDGRMLDADNAELSVCLYVDENGRLLELEFIRWDPTDLLSPQWSTLQVYK